MKITVIPREKWKGGPEWVRVALNSEIFESRFGIDQNGCKSLEIQPAIFNKKVHRRNFVLISRQMVFFAKKNRLAKIIIDWNEIKKLRLSDKIGDLAEILAVNFEMANYEFIKYKNPPENPKRGWFFVEEAVILADRKDVDKIEKSIRKGQIIGEEINVSRSLSNTPGGEMTPVLLASEIKKSANGTKIKIKILETEDMKKLGMGAILGVAHGSCEKPKFIIMEYEGKKEKQPVVLVGKAVTFDTGGLNLKPSDGLAGMHMDMSGGAAVAHAIIAAAKLGIKKRIIGLIPAAENMPSGESYRPGDILKSMSGKTIEVLNTDAEGRILMADAFTYAERYNPRLVVDVATLTGAAAITMGERASVIMSRDENMIRLFQELGEKSGDYVWPLPLWDEYEPEIKGINADLANIKSQGNSRYGGSIVAGMFLYQFAKNFSRWVHIDMAPREQATEDEFLAKGSSGSLIRLLVRLLETYK